MDVCGKTTPHVLTIEMGALGEVACDNSVCPPVELHDEPPVLHQTFCVLWSCMAADPTWFAHHNTMKSNVSCIVMSVYCVVVNVSEPGTKQIKVRKLLQYPKVTLCSSSWVQDYVVHHRPALCTTELHCAPWCTRGTYVREKWGSHPTFFIFWQFTRYDVRASCDSTAQRHTIV